MIPSDLESKTGSYWEEFTILIPYLKLKKDAIYSPVAENRKNIFDKNQTKNVIEAELDPNHTHFILVDDGSNGIYGKEIEFRAKFENELRKGKSTIHYKNSRFNRRKRIASEGSHSDNFIDNQYDDDRDEYETEKLKSGLKKDFIPMVLIVVQGGPNTLQSVAEAIKQNVPILVLAVIK